MTGLGPEFSSRQRQVVVDQAGKSGAVFMAVQFEDQPGSFEDRHSYEYVLDNLAQQSGGLHQAILSSMGLAKALKALGTDLASQYRLRYATLSELKDRKIEVKVARPGVRVRIAAPRLGS